MFYMHHCVAFNGSQDVVSPYLNLYSKCASSPDFPFLMLFDLWAGEACPASWTPGKDTIKTNPYESKEYFKAHYADDAL
jgi:hypothetical protein